jgi:hypothetical protein
VEWWRWLAASVEALLLTVFVLLWYDDLQQNPKWSPGKARKAAWLASVSIPIGFVVVLLVPLWTGLILIAIPAIVVAVMAMAS